MRSAPSLPQQTRPVEVTVHCGDLSSLAPTWVELADPCHPGAAFRSWAWISAWWKMFSSGRKPFVLVARAGTDVVGLLPLCSTPSPLGGRRLALMGDGIVGSDYLGIVCRAGDEERLAREFAVHLARVACDELRLDDLVHGDPLLPALEGF